MTASGHGSYARVLVREAAAKILRRSREAKKRRFFNGHYPGLLLGPRCPLLTDHDSRHQTGLYV